MNRRPRPPTPLPAKQLWTRLQWSMAGVCLFGIVVAVIAWRVREDAQSLLIAGPGFLLLAATMTHQIPGVPQALILGASTSAGWLFRYPLIGFALGAGYLVVGEIRSRKLPADLTDDSLVELPDFLVGPGAGGFVQEFLDLGYQPAGAYGFPVMGNVIVASIMLGPKDDRYATVTDAILTLTSQFGGRTLVTRNSATSRLAPHMLDNPLRGAKPTELDRCHTDALALLEPRAVPEVLELEAAVGRAVINERSNIAWIWTQDHHLLPGGGLGAGPLAENPEADALVRAWLWTEPQSGANPPV